MANPYEPIACGAYDQLESLAVKRTVCRIQFVTDGQIESVQSRIVDVFARNKEEFIKIEDRREIRLDRLHSIDGEPLGGSCKLE